MWLGCIALMAVGIYVALELDIPLLKNLCIMSGGGIGAYIGETYLSNKKKITTRKKWLIYIVLILVLTALVTWLLEGRLW